MLAFGRDQLTKNNADLQQYLGTCSHGDVDTDCDDFGSTEVSFFGESGGSNICGIRIDNVSYKSDSLWKVEITECTGDPCCWGSEYTHGDLWLTILQKPGPMTLSHPDIGEDGQITSG